VSGEDLFVAFQTGTIGEYTTSGATVNASLVSGLNALSGIAVFGDDVFVTNGSMISEYTTSGATVNASLISGLGSPLGPFAITVVPEPSTMVLACLAAAGLAVMAMCKRRCAA
jgi:hypothetical protein